MLLEPRQEQSAYPCAAEVAAQRVLCRHVLIQAVHDLGCGGQREREDVNGFIETPWFSVLCDHSDWDESWVRNILASIGMLRESVRKAVTRQVVHMLKAVAEVQLV